jgi:hypothetical protein
VPDAFPHSSTSKDRLNKPFNCFPARRTSRSSARCSKTEQDVDALGRFDQKGGRYPAKWADLGPRYNQ